MGTASTQREASAKKGTRRRRGAAIPLEGAPRRIGVGVEILKDAIRRGKLRAFPQDGQAFVEVEELERFRAVHASEKRRAREAEPERYRVEPILSAGKGRGFVAALRLRLAKVLRKRGSVAGMTLENNSPGDSALRNHSHDGVERVRRALQGERGVLTRSIETATRRREFAKQRLRAWGG